MEPPHKRQKLDTSNTRASQLFAPFRSLGHISNGIPFALQVQGSVGLQQPEFNIISCTGRSWAMWGGKDMKLRFVGTETRQPIASLAVEGNDVFAAAGDRIFRYRRGKIHATYEAPQELAEVVTFGSHLVAIAKSGRAMYVWDTNAQGIKSEIHFAPDFSATRLLHPATYLNKVLTASKEGGLQLWNVATASLIHEFRPSVVSQQAAMITALEQSPVVDIIAIGFGNGRICVYDIRMGESLFEVHHSSHSNVEQRSRDGQSAVTAIAFRTDNLAQTMAAASASGSISLWDLDPPKEGQETDDEDGTPTIGRLLHVAQDAHEGTVGGLAWLPGQALLISSGSDNSIKQWAFDTPTSEPRLLRSRSGHTAPPSLIRYYGEDGKTILSAGSGASRGHGGTEDRSLRYTSVVRDSRSFELSQGALQRKSRKSQLTMGSLRAPPITAMHWSTARSADWDDVVTCHAGDDIGRTWNVIHKRKGNWNLQLDMHGAGVSAKCCQVTACGNFGLIGFSDGLIGLWNLQSGIHRRLYDTRMGMKTSSVSGVVCDSLNRRIVASTQSGQLHWFDFHTAKHQGSITLPAGISAISLHRENNLLALSCDDMSVRIVDIETQRVVRDLNAFRGRIVDLAFSPDSRWLIVASAESGVRTFDLPTGRLIDAFRTSAPITSLSFSPTGDFLATAHVGNVGISLWANRAQFAEISFRTAAQDDAMEELSLPLQQGEEEVPIELEEYAVPADWPAELDIKPSAVQIDTSLLTLSDQPRSKWQTLLNLDTIRARNKPQEPPKAPETAPFFIPTLAGAGETRFDLSTSSFEAAKKSDASRLAVSSGSVRSETVELLLNQSVDSDYQAFFTYLFALSASALDLEMRTLTPGDLAPMLRALNVRLRSCRDFEAIQAVLAVLLRVQGDVLVGLDTDQSEEDEIAAERQEALAELEKLSIVQQSQAKKLGELVGYALGGLGFIR